MLGAIAKLGKSTITLVMFVRQSTQPSAWKKVGSRWADFHQISYFIIF
jgi:hypothetical protein